MRRLPLACVLACLGLARGQTGVPSLAEPAPAPDRPEIAFVSGGDIWRAPATGGEASLLVSHPAQESRPLYSPNGAHLAFVSNRTGNGDIYILALQTGDLRRLTWDDAAEQLDAWSPDGQWIYFTSSARDIAGMNDVFRVRAAGGTPMPASADRYASEFFPAPSPDGKTLALNARGIASTQWWRKGHSHLDIAEIWLRPLAGPPAYRKLTDGGAKEIWPMWAPDAKSLYFVSDRTGAENLWRQPLGGTSRQLTQFKDGRVLWPSIAKDGKHIYFERDFAIWRAETSNGKAAALPITLRGAPAAPAPSRLSLSGQFQELALSPDGKKIALIGRGEVFAAPAKGGDAERVTRTPANEDQLAWAPDSRRLAYVSDRDGLYHVYLYDFGGRKETQLTSAAVSDAAPRFSPDGKRLAYTRGGREIWLYDFDRKQERLIAKAETDFQPLVRPRLLAWSPDSKWLAYGSTGAKGFLNIHVRGVDAEIGGQVSFLANSYSASVCWSPAGDYLLFDTGQRTEPGQVARVDLVPRTPKFREDEFRDLFRPSGAPRAAAAPAAGQPKEKPEPKPVAIAFDEIRRRLRLLPVGLDAGALTISPDGKTLLLAAESANRTNLYTYPLDELAREAPAARQLTSTSGGKSSEQFSPDGKEVWYLEQGRVQAVAVESRQTRTVAVTAEMDADFDQEKREVFFQAWSYQRDHFFDEKFNGADWEAVRQRFEPRALGARTPLELYRVLNLMMGELNASHLGVSPPASQGPSRGGVGRLGLRFDPAEYEASGRFRIAEVISLGPGALAGLTLGQYLLEVNGAPLAAQTNLDQLLDHTVDRKVELTVAAAADGAGKRTVAVRPVSLATEKNLLYRHWVEDRRAMVEKIAGGKLGYVHMRDMSAESLARLYVDLDTDNHAKQGVVVDIRNNQGGFVNVYAIDVLARRPYLTMRQRGREGAPARSVLGQRALELPTILITNQHSLSDAEDFTEGYRRLKLGKVVGEPTAGWIVYTWGQRLIDGAIVRMPRTKVFDLDGQLMEMRPRPVDVPVSRPIGESYTGADTQLETAVKELLADLAR